MPRFVLAAVVLAAFAARLNAGPTDDAAFFESRIRPVLVEKCQSCHGSIKVKGGLRLDSRDGVLRGGDTGPAVIPGDPDASLLVKAVRRAGHLKMPPKQPLTDREAADLAEWVRKKVPWPSDKAGGPAAELWSLKPVADPAVPALSPASRSGANNAIDNFIFAKLDAAGITTPRAAADRHTLIRRVTFDLTGLPPTPEEVDAFINDSSPGAYERLIDRLLASPAYGQRWGRHWLDLVRYCDSFDARITGTSDMDCLDAWRYRDWVVSALNRDLPYDKFVRMQIAGDVLPLPDAEKTDGIIATGMLAIGNWGGGDADKDKLLTDIVDDQIDVVGRSVLGLTLACARCHDHKFDPVTTADYYALAGVFFSTHILANVGPKTNGPPMLRIPLESPVDVARRLDLEDRARALDKKFAESLAARRVTLVKRLRSELAAHLLAAHDLAENAADRAKLADATAARKLDPVLLKACLDSFRPTGGEVLGRHETKVHGKPGLHAWRAAKSDPPSLVANTTAAEIRFLTIRMPPRAVSVHPGPATDVAVIWTSPVADEVTIAGRVSDFDPNCGDGFAYDLRLGSPGGSRSLSSATVDNGKAAEIGKPTAIKLHVAVGDRIELVVKRRAEYSCDTTGVELTIRGTGRSWDFAADWLAAEPPPSARVGPWSAEELIGTTTPLTAPLRQALADWAEARRHSDRERLARAAQAVADSAADAGGSPFLPPDDRLAEFIPSEERIELDRVRGELAAIRKELAAPKTFANGAQEGGVPSSPHAGTHDVRVHLRGRYDRLGDLMPRRFPEVIRVSSPPVNVSGSGRKEFADWLTRPDHPLTSRVIVNRVWQHHFGEGLVRTPSNFGTLGEPPTHPELLDHLAAKFVREGWSFKKLHKYILLSATYRQASSPHVKDPDNRLLGSFPRHRLESEAVRDSLLAAAGKLDVKAGGPATRDFHSPRRTLYLMTIRSDRTGFGPLFDVADSTAPVDKRTVSTVAPQALFLMNHPFVKEQAKAFAARVLARGGTEADRLTFAHRVAFGRPPTDEELSVGRQIVAGGSRGAWETWCHLLFEANEFVVIE
jgi:hypothetical protein